MSAPAEFDGIEACIDAMLAVVGKRIVLGIPLGTGKPNAFVNALYRRACEDPDLKLDIFTALTPSVPHGRSLLEQRFLGPVVERLYGEFEPLAYDDAVRRSRLPTNVSVTEFYFSPAAYLRSDYAQQHYVSENYSHVTHALIDRGVNVVAQAVARRGTGMSARYSLGSNPDLTLDLVAEVEPGKRPYLIGIVTDAMPFMPNDAETAPGFWNAIVETQGDSPALFAVPNQPVHLVDYAIATHVTSLIEDGGTLQIGIGSLGDAVAHVIRLRQTCNDVYRRLTESLIDAPRQSLRAALRVETGAFETGLYGSSEMLVEGFLDLIDAGVLKREVASKNDPARRILLHAGFFIGSPAFYRRLHALGDAVRDAIEMTGIRFVNTLDDEFVGKCERRRRARFVNSAMMVTLDGAIVSDGRADKRVVSGVGGQHDFVGMAQHLPGARSIIVLPSTRTRGGRARSNIVFDYGHTTVARQFRDIVATEYGAADLRAASDRDVMVRLIQIADSRFQPGLLREAKAAGKIEGDYRIPDAFRRNLPGTLGRRLGGELLRQLPRFPLSSDFDADEARIAIALDWLKSCKDSKLALARLVLQAPRATEAEQGLLERMGLARPRGLEERIGRRLLLAGLEQTSDERPLFNV